MTQKNQTTYDHRVNPRERIHKDRSATWLELFFDLAYVAVIAQLTYFAGSHHSPGELVVFVIMFAAIFWLWWMSTAGSNILEEDDIGNVLGLQVQMFFALSMSMFIGTIFSGGATGFLWGLVAVKITQAIFFVRMYINHPERRPKTYNILTGNLISVVLWALTILVPAPLQYIFWAILVLFDYLIPQTKGRGNIVTILNPTHLQERLGLFLLLVMGESVIVVAVSSGLSGLIGKESFGLVGASAMLMMVGLWWLYFPYFDEVARGKRTRSLQLFITSHALLFLAVILLAVGVKEFVGELKDGTPEHITNFIIFSLGLTIVSFALIKHAMGHFGRDCLKIAIVSLATLSGLYLLARSYTTTAAIEMLILAVLFVLYVKIEYRHTHTVHKQTVIDSSEPKS